MTFGSLFSGIGGIDLGLERAGMTCLWQIEKDAFCQRVLAKHWPKVKRYEDIKTVKGSELEPVDLLAGGFPCQDVSSAGKRVGIEGARSGLWSEFHRLIGELRPRFVFVENVRGLVRRGLSRVLMELAQLGYDAEWQVISAASVGAPHIRERLFLVAYPHSATARSIFGSAYRQRWKSADTLQPKVIRQRNGTDGSKGFASSDPVSANSKSERCRPRGLPFGASKEKSFVSDGSEVLPDSDSERLPEGADDIFTGEPITGSSSEDMADSNSLWEPQQEGSEPELGGWSCDGCEGSIERFRDTIGKSQWAIEPDVGRMAHGVPKRVDRLRGLGNSVVPQVIQWIGRKILEAEERE